MFKGFTISNIIEWILWLGIVLFGSYILVKYGMVECLLYYICIILNNIAYYIRKLTPKND